jgi:hypothetical protein
MVVFASFPMALPKMMLPSRQRSRLRKPRKTTKRKRKRKRAMSLQQKRRVK